MRRVKCGAVPGSQRHRELVRLAAVADVQGRRQRHPPARALDAERAPRPGQERAETAREHARRRRDEAYGLDVVAAQVGGQGAPRREDAGVPRHEDAPHAERIGQLARVHARGAAERDQRVLARVVAAFDRDSADGPLHAGVDDADDVLRRRLDAAAQLARQHLHGAAGSGDVEAHFAAEERFRHEAAEQKVGVGDRRPFAAAVHAGPGSAPAPAGRRSTRHRRRTRRAAAAGADGVDVDRGDSPQVADAPSCALASGAVGEISRRWTSRPCRR
jgi:hypothetical protein